MPTYEYRCTCGWRGDLVQPIELRDQAHCPNCTRPPERQVSAPLFRFAGRVTPGGGPDRFTADMLGVPLKDLPEGLKSDR
jgi:putative FmdB family regulatory protein